MISPSSDVVTSIAAAGLAAPLDLSKLPSYSQLSDRLRNAPLVRINGNVYGVPFVWGPNPVSYTHLDVYKRQVQVWLRFHCCTRVW